MVTEKQEQAVITNLVDAGYSHEQTEQFISLLRDGQKDAMLSLLAKHRRSLLDRYHAVQKKIDCLDYLVYQIGQLQ